MRASWGPAHLLPLDEPPGNDLVDGRFHKSRRNTFPTPMTLPIVRVTYLFHQNWRPEELANVESMSCSRMNSRRRSQSCDDCVDAGINGLQRPLTQCITQGASH